MKALLFILILVSFSLQAQVDLRALLSTTHAPAETRIAAEGRINNFIASMEARHGDDEKKLRKVFNGLHANFLKKYKAYSDFDDIFSKGSYDCLSATALFCTVLTQLHYTFRMMETNYHIFLMVQTSQGEVLIETTDRLGGFLTRRESIDDRLQEYKKNIPITVNASRYLYSYPFSLFQEISDQNLSGLLYFNQAVKAYNGHDVITCSVLLEKSNALYASPRCESLASLLIDSIHESKLDEKTKADCMVRLKVFMLKKPDFVASY